ncbi:hypothetical protein DL765_003204 [Monosporascus sp. GIB2]|nr:hypothetical protein DL765_003204 [Monosporascus sp. GIB2]
MQLNALIFALLPAVATVSAECHRSGITWGVHRDAALRAVDAFCHPSYIGGYFNEGQKKTRCVTTGQQHVDFEVQWRGRGGLTLANQDCQRRLKDEILGCDRGGYKTTADWYFSADPNEGTC